MQGRLTEATHYSPHYYPVEGNAYDQFRRWHAGTKFRGSVRVNGCKLREIGVARPHAKSFMFHRFKTWRVSIISGSLCTRIARPYRPEEQCRHRYLRAASERAFNAAKWVSATYVVYLGARLGLGPPSSPSIGSGTRRFPIVSTRVDGRNFIISKDFLSLLLSSHHS